MADRKRAKTVNEVRARITGARRPTTSKETPPPRRKTTGTPKTPTSKGPHGNITQRKTHNPKPISDPGYKRKTTGRPKTSTMGEGTAPTSKGPGGMANPPKTKKPKPNVDRTATSSRPGRGPTPRLEISAGNPPRGRKVVDPRRNTNPPKKLTVTTGRRKPLRNSRSPFVFEYK
jgi:hypothetical protein